MSDAIKALVKAQKEMGAVIKNTTNPHLKSKYADLGAVLDACQSALHGNGFAIMQPSGKDEYGQFVDTILAHESGEKLSSRVYLVIGKQDMQGVGSAITYARRYGLLGMTGLAPEDDDGEATKAPKPQRQDANPHAVIVARDVLAAAESVDTLNAIWRDLPEAVKADASVLDAAKTRKSQLTAKDAA